MLHTFNLPYRVDNLAMTSRGDLAMVWVSSAGGGIFTTNGILKQNLSVPNGTISYGISVYKQMLCVTDADRTRLHLIQDDGTYVTTVDTEIKGIHMTASLNNTIWIIVKILGIFRITLDNEYKIIERRLLIPNSRKYFQIWCMSVLPSHLVVGISAANYSKLHFFKHDGSTLYPPVGELGTGPGQMKHLYDIVTDSFGRFYVADTFNFRILVYSERGRFLNILISNHFGLDNAPTGLLLHDNILYAAIGWAKPPKLQVMELKYHQ